MESGVFLASVSIDAESLPFGALTSRAPGYIQGTPQQPIVERHVPMATDGISQVDQEFKDVDELLASIKKELDDDAHSHARLHAGAAAAGDQLLHDSRSGVTIDLSRSNLRTLPLEAIELMKHKVERLAVSQNPQFSLPSEIVRCERLRYLNLRRAQLTDFPAVVLQLPKLEILDLSRNKLTSVPDEIVKLSSLKFLALSHNRISRLPYVLGDIGSLAKLKFEGNPIEFPPAEVYTLPADYSAGDQDRDKEICQRVKRFLRTAAAKEKPRLVAQQEQSEDHVETPRPPKRSLFGGRFPIRSSISGGDIGMAQKTISPADQGPPPIPQKSHARVESSNASFAKRPGVTPLPADGNDNTRSRSETVSSSISLRQRRQGFVPNRKPAGDLASVSEDARVVNLASTRKPAHTRGTSSVSTMSSTVAPSSGETSGAVSPVGGAGLGALRQPSSLTQSQTSKTQRHSAMTACRRLVYTLVELGSPITNVAVAFKDGATHNSSLGRHLFTAQWHVKELGRLLSQMDGISEARVRSEHEIKTSVIRAAIATSKSHGLLIAELRRKAAKSAQCVDGFHLRSLMLRIQGTMVELRNICVALGFKVNESAADQDRSRVSQAWSSKSITPTQPKAPNNRRMPRPPTLQGMGMNSMQRAMPPPPMSIKPSFYRSRATPTQNAVGTPRLVESFASLDANNTTLSRDNTMRTYLDDSDGDEQFDRIFFKLQAACDMASQALPHCRKEFQARRAVAQISDQRGLAHQWSVLISKCEDVIANKRALKKRLDSVKVNDPALRHQRDFWQLCDAFVHSWTDLATEVKELGQQHVDVSPIKNAMRHVQQRVKDVSKAISSSPLYHQALGSNNKPVGIAVPPNLASPFPSSWHSASQSHEAARAQNGQVTSPIAATPLSAALGPAAHAMVATPNSTSVPREYLHEPPPARQMRDRNDTPMQQSSYQRKL